ncbi:MAG: hypothetical protein RL701_3065 [Pseudomonadota bacterium]|jgi:uncharacterized protein YndB with AHSA1/START domain
MKGQCYDPTINMAQSVNYLHSHATPESVFDFISDFRHAPLWDPNTRSVTKLTGGGIAAGTRFLLHARMLGVTFDLPYTIEAYERPTRLVFVGETTWLGYREQITFASGPAGVGGTDIVYTAYMHFRSILALANPALALVYQRVGDSATSGIVAALEHASGPAAAAASNGV